VVNLFKKGFIYLALMLLVLVSFSVESASAAEAVDYEEGVTNLNNTPENSAVVGSQLLKPEIGWKRYDDRHPSILYKGNHGSLNTAGTYKTSESGIYPGGDIATEYIGFDFYGTKLRIIGNNSKGDGPVNITIDNISYEYNPYASNTKRQLILFELTNLKEERHTVMITRKVANITLGIDAIDVDGQLLAPGEVPNVQSITLDKNNLELLEGSQDKITATVTPNSAKVIWTSSDESIATVDQNGNVIAIREGEAIITATIENTDISATSTVIVKKPISESSSAILSITLVNGITKEYDVTNAVLNNYLNWFDSAQGTATFKFSKTISPYKKVTEYVVHDKIASFEVREY